MIIYLVEAQGYNPATLQVETLRFSTGRGMTTSPTDTPASVVYEPRVENAGSLNFKMFDQGTDQATTSGRISSGFGEVTLSNADGALDYLKDWGFDGRDITVKWGDEYAPVSTFSTLYKATMQQAKPEMNLLTLVIRDKQFILNRPAQDLRFQGDNAAPYGLEGTANDIKGKPKPLVVGRPFNVTPVCVNTSMLIYALNVRHGGQFDAVPDVDSLPDFDAANVAVNATSGIDIVNVYDKGVVLTRGADYADSDAMQATAPDAGTYRVCPSEGYFRMGSTPSGSITVECQDGMSATVDPYIGNLSKQVLNQLLSVTDEQINLDDIAAANTAYPATIGVFINEDTTGGAVLDQLASSGGFWYGFDRLGMFRLRQINLPTVASLGLTLDDITIETAEILGVSDTGNGVPCKRVNLNWRKNYTVLNPADLAGSVDQDARTQLGMEFRQAFYEDPSVLQKHLLAGELSFDTACYDDPTSESQRRFNIYSVARDRLQLTLKIAPGMEDLLNLGETLTVKYPRYGYDNGKIRMIIGFDLDCSTNTLTLTLWG